MASELYELIVKDPSLKNVFREFGRRISLGKVANNEKAGNFDAKHLAINFVAANTEHRIEHGLSRTPVGLIQTMDFTVGSACGIRLEVTKAPDSKFLYLKSAEIKRITILIW